MLFLSDAASNVFREQVEIAEVLAVRAVGALAKACKKRNMPSCGSTGYTEAGSR